MSSSWFDDHSLKCPFVVAYPFLKVYTVEDFLCCCSPSAYLLFPLAVTNISSNPFFLMCPPYRVHYKAKSPSIIYVIFSTYWKTFEIQSASDIENFGYLEIVLTDLVVPVSSVLLDVHFPALPYIQALTSISSFIWPKKLSCSALSQQFPRLDMNWSWVASFPLLCTLSLHPPIYVYSIRCPCS